MSSRRRVTRELAVLFLAVGVLVNVRHGSRWLALVDFLGLVVLVLIDP